MAYMEDLVARYRAAEQSGDEEKRRLVLAEATLGLMRGNAEELKVGYSAENAALAVASLYEVTDAEVKDALTPRVNTGEFVAFLRFMEDRGHSASDVIYAVEKPHKHWIDYADFCVAQEEGTMPTPTTTVGGAT